MKMLGDFCISSLAGSSRRGKTRGFCLSRKAATSGHPLSISAMLRNFTMKLTASLICSIGYIVIPRLNNYESVFGEDVNFTMTI